jgi:Uma2 family endonuclease
MAVPARKMPADWELEPAPSADPFRYGWRPKYVHLPSGEVIEEQIPLTPEDLLDPQLGDVVPQSGEHFDYAHLAVHLLRDHYASQPDVYVAGDMKMLWGIPGLPEPSPDVAVIPGYRPREKPPTSFNVLAEGTRPCLVLEVVSPSDPELLQNDYVKKVEIYQRAGVPEYILLDPPRPATKNRLLLTGHRLGTDGRYRPIEPDGEGFLLSETTQLRFGVDRDGKSLVILDAMTGQRLLTSEDLRAALQVETETRRAAEEQARAAEERASQQTEIRRAAEAEIARLRAELDRLRQGSDS